MTFLWCTIFFMTKFILWWTLLRLNINFDQLYDHKCVFLCNFKDLLSFYNLPYYSCKILEHTFIQKTNGFILFYFVRNSIQTLELHTITYYTIYEVLYFVYLHVQHVLYYNVLFKHLTELWSNQAQSSLMFTLMWRNS